MPVPVQNTYIVYNADGLTSTFFFPYYLAKLSDLKVTELIGNVMPVVEYFLISDFTIVGLPDAFGAFPFGLDVVFNSPPLAGLLLLSRSTDKTQLLQLLDNDPFTAESLNHVFDKLTVIEQDYAAQFKGNALGPPTSLLVPYVLGDWFKNTRPAAGGNFGWICTSPGSPGIWKEFGAIAT